jgi:PadR family transcriptional regulator, regulatory protein PadR
MSQKKKSSHSPHLCRAPYRHSRIDIPKDACYAHLCTPMEEKSEILQGTLDLMVLKTLDALGPLHGYGIARRIEQISEDVLRMNEGTVYASLLRLQQKGWILASWGVSENNRRAKFYAITRSGRKQLTKEAANWRRIAGVLGRLLSLEPGE